MKTKNKLSVKQIPLFLLVAVNLYLTRFLWQEIAISFSKKAEAETLTLVNNFNSTVLAQNVNKNLQTGQTIIINNRSFPASWIYWQDQEKQHLGIGDFSAVNLLGIDLFDTENPDIQPLNWYNDNRGQNYQVNAQFITPYRYLDLTDLLTENGLTFKIENNTLILDQNNSNVTNISTFDQDNKQEIFVTLDQPIPWQVSENNQEAVIMLSANIDPSFLEQFAPPLPPIETELENNNPLVDDPSEIKNEPIKPPLLILEKAENQLKLKINKSANYGVKVTSLQNPYRLQIEVIPDSLKPNNILWYEGVRLRKQYISLDTRDVNNPDYFPVSWLEIDLKSPDISLLPIHPNSDTIVGSEPLLTTARNFLASASINGGFFNRNNQYPLGAIRNNYDWLSSPILNRGVMAWDDQGNVKFDRLTIEETLTKNNDLSLPILFINSGYIKAGISRYDSHWGSNYTPLSNNEIIITVVDDQITKKDPVQMAGSSQFSIPNNGYLLIFRSYVSGANQLEIGDTVSLKSFTNPKEFDRYPYIMGAGPLLIKNNQIVLNAELEGFTEAFINQKASRSAIALNKEGKLLIVTAHNRIGGSGATLEEWAQILHSLGAVEALNLDGGSSTSLYLGGQLIDRSAVTAARVNNGLGLFINP